MKRTIDVTAQVLVNVQFQIDVETSSSLEDTEKLAQGAAERVALGVIGMRGEKASASVHRTTSFTMRLV